MKFKATTWVERNYKVVAAFLILIVTVICCYVFIKTPTSNASFFVSLLYALALYLIGVFKNTTSEKISSDFQHKIEIYINLKKAKEILDIAVEERKPFLNPNAALDRLGELRNDIHTFIVFTGNKDDEELKKHSYVKTLGITYDESFLQEINLYLKTIDTIVEDVHTKLIAHIQQNGVQTKVPHPHFRVENISNPKAWCLENIVGNHKKVLDLIYASYDQYQAEFELLRTSLLLIEGKFRLYRKACIKNISQIEQLYGRRIPDYFEQEKWHYEDVEYIKKAIADAESNLTTQLDDIREELGYISRQLEYDD